MEKEVNLLFLYRADIICSVAGTSKMQLQQQLLCNKQQV